MSFNLELNYRFQCDCCDIVYVDSYDISRGAEGPKKVHPPGWVTITADWKILDYCGECAEATFGRKVT